tara:strand:+ start:8308 stop:9909 length:1602 start_codon:yes stop_codon:yes gene_type:complete
MIYAIDFDDTLNFSSLGDKFNPNYKLISFLRDKNFFILTARGGTDSNKNYINDFLELNLLFPNKVIFTNKASKGPFLKEEAADHLVDDNAEQRGSAEEYGVKATHPKDLEDLIFSMKKSADLKETDNLNSDYLPADELRDKSWYRSNDKSWYYWVKGETDLKNKPLNPDDALRDLINFSYKNGIETLPSCEGHVLSNEEANSTFKKLLRDKEKINNTGLELTNTEDKSEKIIFKDPDYNLPFDEPKDLIHERYSGYIGLKFNNKGLPEYIYEQIADIDKAVDVKLENNTLHIYIDSNSQEKQKDLWKEITEIIKAEVEVSKKEARKKYFCSLLKEAKDPKTKARLRRAFKYAEERKKKTEKKTEKMKKESRKKRISFFRSNLDYGKEKFKKIEDKAEDHDDLTKSKKISNLLSFLPSEILQEKEEFNEEKGEEGILVKNVPMTSLSMVKGQADRVLRDIRRGELSMTAGLPVLFYNAREQQLIVDDGNHRIFQRWLSGEDYFDAYIYSGSYHNYLRHVYDGEEKFNWNIKRPL